MKQEMPSTFILNRNDKQYFYVEGKKSRIHGPSYHVYYSKDEKPIHYRAENFVEVHGLDEKQKISTFTEQALLNLRILIGINEDAEDTYNKFYNIYMQTKNANSKRPVLSISSRNSFIEAISKYNNIKESLSNDVEIPFEENYRLVNPELNRNLSKGKENDNYSMNKDNLDESYEKGIQRVLKKAA